MVYQIPRGGIADNAIDTDKLATDAVQSADIGTAAVTLEKLSSDAKKYGTYSETATNQSITLVEADLNQFLYLDAPASGNTYAITLPLLADTTIGFWITFVTNGAWGDSDDYVTVIPATGDSINTIGATNIKITSPESGSTTVTIVRGLDGWIVTDYSTRSRLSNKTSNSIYDSLDLPTAASISQQASSELVYITSSTSLYSLNSSPANGSMVTFVFENAIDPSDLEIVSAGNANDIMGEDSLIVDTPVTSLTLIFVNRTIGWRLI
jgi:hypothetical protein